MDKEQTKTPQKGATHKKNDAPVHAQNDGGTNTRTLPTRALRRKQGQRPTPEQKQSAKDMFLETYRKTANVKYSCEQAEIGRTTFYEWKANDTDFQKALEEAEPDADDTLEYAAYQRAVEGVEEPVLSMGKAVYGNDGQPMMVRKYSDALLTTLLKARMPHKYKDKVEHSGKDGGPIKIVTQWGGGVIEDDDHNEEH